MRAKMEKILRDKGIEYSDLKNALIPHRDRKEVALFFDTLNIQEYSYGRQVLNKLLPLLNKGSNHSVLVGDYVGEQFGQKLLFEEFSKIHLYNQTQWHHSSQYYVVYLNNQSDQMIDTILSGLKTWGGFVGYADVTYSSILKWMLSFHLRHLFIKFKTTIILEHEDDRPDSEDINIQDFTPEKFGYSCKSLSGYLYGVFLTYKIERPVFGQYSIDGDMALNALVPSPMNLTEFEVLIHEDKLKYLKSEKSGSLKKSSLDNITKKGLERIIKDRIFYNYIYNLSELHEIRKFNIMLEVNNANGDTVKLIAALEYNLAEKQLRLITLF